MHTLVIRLDHTQNRQAITATIAIQRKTLRLLRGRWKSRFPVTVKDPFSLRLSLKRPGTSQRSKTRFWQCYTKGMSRRDISDIVEDIYGFGISAETISQITHRVYPVVDEWRNRPLKVCYPFVFVDCIYVSVKTEHGAQEQAVYAVLGYDTDGHKDILGLWIGESESKHFLDGDL